MNSLRMGRNFWFYFFIMFCSAFVDNILKNAIIVYCLFNNVTLLGLSTESLAPFAAGLFILPFLFFSATSGQFSDFVDKKRVVIFCKFFEFIIGTVVFLFFSSEKFTILFFCLFLLGLHSTIFGPAKYSMIKDLVKKEHFILATAWVEAGTFISILLGTIIGSVLGGFSKENIWAVGILMMCISFCSTAISFFLPNFSSNNKAKVDWNIFRSSLTIVKLTKTIPKLNTVVRQISWFYFLATFVVTMLPAIVKSDLHQDKHWVSWIYGLFIVGVASGSFLYEKISSKEINLSPMFSSMWYILWLLLFSAYLLMIPFTFNVFVILLIVMFLLALCLGVFSTPLYALLQRLPGEHWQSQAVASNNIINSLYMIAASILQLVLYELNFNHAQMLIVVAVCWIWVKREFFRTYAYEIMFHAIHFILSFRYKAVIRGEKVTTDNNRPVIIVSNHVSFIDWAFLELAAKENISFVMWYLYYKIPGLKFAFKSAGAIPIAGKKEDMDYYLKSFSMIDSVLKENKNILLLFPEGFITRTGNIEFFRPGINLILKNYGKEVSIVPMHLGGLWGSILSRNPNCWKGLWGRLFRRRVVTISIGKPIVVKDNVDLEMLRKLVLDLAT